MNLIAQRVFNVPLLLTAAKAEIIGAVVLARKGAETSSRPEVDEDPQVIYAGLSQVRGSGSQVSSSNDRIAVINIAGSLVHKSGGMKAMSGLRSYTDITEDVQTAVDDPSVRGILLRVDSPGGEVSGAFDTADLIHAAAQKKAIWSIAEDSALSAGYLLCSQASRVFVTQSGLAGSVGVVLLHHDLSGAEAKAGVKITTLFRGARKADMSPHAPITKEAKERAEHLLSTYYEKFVSAVSRGRNIGAQAVRDTEAGIYLGQQAVRAGLADAVGSYRDVLAHFSAHLSRSPKAVGDVRWMSSNSVASVKAQVRMQALCEASSIARLCEYAGFPAMTERFLREGKSLSAVTSVLRKLREDSPGFGALPYTN